MIDRFNRMTPTRWLGSKNVRVISQRGLAALLLPEGPTMSWSGLAALVLEHTAIPENLVTGRNSPREVEDESAMEVEIGD